MLTKMCQHVACSLSGMQRKTKSLPDSVLVFYKGALCKFTSVPTKSFRPNKHM